MRSEQLVRFRRLFEEQLAKLSAKPTTPSEGFGVRPEETIDALDHARDQAEQFVRIEMHNREQAVLIKVRQALQRIRDGVFGTCFDCDGDIELKRLEARPTANLCLDCQKQTELKAEQNRTPGLSQLRMLRLQGRPA